mmetsp:Transcript_3779/g.11588  ORF Transcript_3779/g.11588 Transcript_3779/m.11588 type:complete len:227 (+) Transcript_3779:24-704(+)
MMMRMLRTLAMVALVEVSPALVMTGRPVCATRRLAATVPMPPVVDGEAEPLWPKAAIAPSSLLSESGLDYAPLMEQLRSGDFKAADQFTRDALIRLAGPNAQKRGYVYFTEASRLPATDLATIELLWLHYSDGKFGYTIQKNVWRVQKQDFENFCRKLGWNVEDSETGQSRKRRWFGNSEFIYDLSAPKGHLPLTSALRGTQLLKAILNHPVWDNDDWKRDLSVDP